ncbi:MAG: sensor histidine kinase [Actinomycetota bacterium]
MTEGRTESRFAELISLIAHELRSPLTSVKGFSSTLLKSWDRFTDEQRLELIGTIYADSERMSRIVTEVVDLARLESGRLELHPTMVRVGPAAAKAWEQLGRLDGSDRVSIHVDETLEVWADPDRLGHILFNVIENAIKYSENGPIAVAAGEDGDEVTISVSDAGVGIEPGRVAGVFSGPGGQGSMPSGTGLGLYLTKQLVDAHGGRISVESTQGEGSKFTIVLPAKGPA